MKNLVLFLVLLSGISFNSCTTSSSKDSNVLIGAYVRDANTQAYFKDADITIMDCDSVVLADPIVREVVRDSLNYRYVWSVPRKEHYIIKATKSGYTTEYINVSLNKNEEQKMAGDILLHKLPSNLNN